MGDLNIIFFDYSFITAEGEGCDEDDGKIQRLSEIITSEIISVSAKNLSYQLTKLK